MDGNFESPFISAEAREVCKQIEKDGIALDVFIALFRHSENLAENLSPEHAGEIFKGILLGESDLTKERFEEVCTSKGTTLFQVLNKNERQIEMSDQENDFSEFADSQVEGLRVEDDCVYWSIGDIEYRRYKGGEHAECRYWTESDSYNSGDEAIPPSVVELLDKLERREIDRNGETIEGRQ